MENSAAIIIGVGCGPAGKGNGLPPLPHAEPAAVRIAQYVGGLGYNSVQSLIGPAATHDNVEIALRAAADVQPALNTVLIVFSGHGFQQDAGRFCEYGSLDEHWCLYDEFMVDHYLLMLTQRFASTTRLFIVADCCYAAEASGVSGRLARALAQNASGPLPDLFARRPASWEGSVDQRREAVVKKPGFDCSPPQAQWLLLAASADDESEPGVFMSAFLRAWEEPDARSTFRAFWMRLVGLGGRPVLRPDKSPLLDLPAFAP